MAPQHTRGARWRSVTSPGVGSRRWLLAASLAALAACWILLTPPGGGPDEASHLTRSGGVVRGDLEGDDIDASRGRGFELPDRYLVPDAGCYAQQPTVPATCAPDPQRSGSTVVLTSSAYDYPVWAHAVAGVPSLLPGLDPVWWARIGGAAVSVALVAASLRIAGRRGHGLLAPAIVLAVTPMAWFSFAVVNPSGIAAAGAIALWTGVLVSGGAGRSASVGWLATAGWVALALPRRDGLIWAAVVLVFALAATGRPLLAWLRSLPRAGLALVAVSTVVAVVWGVTRDSRSSQLSALAPLLVVAAEAVRVRWSRAPGRASRLGLAAAVTAAGGVAALFVLTTRPGGLDWNHTARVIGESGNNLVEAIGVLGWLDVVLPWIAVAAWVAVLGVLAAVSLLDSARPTAMAAVLLAVALVTSWAFELYSGNESGTYWQGRYSLPLLAGIPLLLAAGARRSSPPARAVVLVGPLAVLNVAAWSAARRFAVGIDGSLLPWEWDGAVAWAPPWVVLVAHAAASGALALALTEREGADRSDRAQVTPG